MECLCTALEDLREHSSRVTLNSAQDPKMAEGASRDARMQEEYSEMISSTS